MPRWVTCPRAYGTPVKGISALLSFLLLFATFTASAAPYAHTQSATLISSNSATLNGMAVANGAPALAWFEWGPTRNYGQTTAPVDVGNGSGVIVVKDAIGGLAPGVAHHYRLVVSNATEVVWGANQAFVTGSKLTSWGMNYAGQTNVPAGLRDVVFATGGYSHSIALKTDGSMVAWGDNVYGEGAVPTPAPNQVAAIAAGAQHNVALQSDGTVVVWGQSYRGQTAVPPDLTNAIAVDCGNFFSVVLRADGTLLAWGTSAGGTNIPASVTNVVAVAAGDSHLLALKADGTVAAWGHNGYGQTNVPPGISNVIAIAAGHQHCLVLKSDGTLTAWGDNSSGISTPPAGLSNVVAIAAGISDSAALKADGTITMWGYNGYNQTVVPVGLTNAVGVSKAQYHSFALANLIPKAVPQIASGPANTDLTIVLAATDSNGETPTFRVATLPAVGTLYQFTTNGRGAAITSPQTAVTDSIGRVIFAPALNGVASPYDSFNFVANDGDVDSLPATVTVNILGTLRAATQPAWVTSATAARLNGMVLANGFETKAWYEWGTNASFGLTTTPTSAGASGTMARVEHPIGGLQPNLSYHFRLVASNANGVVRGAHQLFTTGKKVAAWGYDDYPNAEAPPGLTDVTSVAGGQIHSLALRANGSVVAWGSPGVGYTTTNIPVSASNVVAVAAGYAHSLALRQDGTAVTWGYMSSGGPVYLVPAGLSNLVMVAAGASHDIVLRSDGSVAVWGQYGNNQAFVPAGLSNVIAIAAVGNYTVALRADGTVVTWGTSTLTPPAGLTNVVAIAGTFALKADGTVVAWGSGGSYNQTNIPPGLSNVVAIAGGLGLALKSDGQLVTWHTNPLIPKTPPLTGVAAIGADTALLAVGDNLVPTAFPQTTVGPMNQDLVITLAGDDFNGDLLTYRIVALPAKGQLYQCNSGARGAPIQLGDTVTDSLARVVFAPATDEFGKPYVNFNFLSNDGTADSPAATVTITITSPTFAVTRAVTHSTATSGQINGVAIAGHLPTTVWFEWGSSRNYGQMTEPRQLVAGNQMEWLSAPVTGLVAQSVYHCRLVASNAGGFAFGADRAFTTGRQAVEWDDIGNQPPYRIGPSNAVAIAAGYSHELMLRNDRTVHGQGDNTWGQLQIPPGLTDVVQIDSGAYHSLALKSDGTVVAWGDPDYNNTTIPPGLANVKQIACGTWHNVALKSDGTVVAWGKNTERQTIVPPGLTDVAAIAAGMFNNVALRSNGTVVAWGGGGSYSSSTNLPPGLSNIVEIEYDAVIKADGSGIMWGNYGPTVPAAWTNADILEVEGGLSLKEDGSLVGAGPNPARFRDAAYFTGTHTYAAIGNFPPLANPQTVKHAANHDVAIGLTATELQYDPLNFRITAIPTRGSLYQFSSGGRGPQIVTNDTPVTDAQGRVVFAPAPDDYGSPYTTFGFTASDLELVSSQAVVTVSIVATPYAQTQLAAPIGPTNAMLNGMVVPNGFPTRTWFEWGTNWSYGQTTAPQDLGAGAQVVRVSSPLQGIARNSEVMFRVVASNAVGVVYGAPQWLTTGRRLVAWGANEYGQVNVPWNLKGVVNVSVGASTSFALKNDGTVAAWGYYTNGMPALSNVVAIEGGVALKSDGTVAVWRPYYPAETNAPPGLSNVVAISGQMALRADGTVAAWGPNNYGQTNVPPGLSNVVAIYSGGSLSLALRADGTAVAWGYEEWYHNNLLKGHSNIVALTAANSEGLALKSDGRVIMWDTWTTSYVPPEATNAIAIARGVDHYLALRKDRTLVMWGENYQGALNKPALATNMVAIAAGSRFSVALRPNRAPSANATSSSGIANQDQFINFNGTDPDNDSLQFRIKTLPTTGTLYQYVSGNRGAAITNADTALTSGTSVLFAPAPDTFANPYATFTFAATDGEEESAPATATVSVTGNFYAATQPAFPIRNSSAVLNGMAVSGGLTTFAWFEWGPNGSFGNTTAPMPVAGGNGLVVITATLTNLSPGGQYHFRLVATNVTGLITGAAQRFQIGGRVTTWGQSSFGLPNVPAGLTNAISIQAGATYSLALGADGVIRGWGGGGTAVLTNVPAAASNVIAITVGDYHNVVLRSNRTLFAWGGNHPSQGETNVPPSFTNIVAISAGGVHTLALRSSGSVVAWGGNSFGQTNTIGGNTVAIAAGGTHSLALRDNGIVVAWGNNASGQRSVPAGLTNVVAIAAGSNHSLALRANGTVVGWGATVLPSGLTNIVQIASGDNHSLALRDNGTVVAWGSNLFGQTNVPAGLSNVFAIAAGANHSLAIGGNVLPVMTNQVVSGFPNRDALVTLIGTDPNGDALNFRVASLPTRGSLYQYNAGARGAEIVSPDTTVTDALARVIFAPAPNEAGSPHGSFTASANDGEFSSPPATVTLNVVLPPPAQLSAAKSGPASFAIATLSAGNSGPSTNGGFALRFPGNSNLTYQVWASTNLVDWALLGTAVATTNSWFQFVDADAPNWPRRFYRISQPGDRAFNLIFSGQSNATYRVWASTNLVNWEVLGTASVISNGWFQFLDFDTARWPQRFYRAGAP